MKKIFTIKAILSHKIETEIKFHDDFQNEGEMAFGLFQIAADDLAKNLVVTKSGQMDRSAYNTYKISVGVSKLKQTGFKKQGLNVEYKPCYRIESLNKEDQNEVISQMITSLNAEKIGLMQA